MSRNNQLRKDLGFKYTIPAIQMHCLDNPAHCLEDHFLLEELIGYQVFAARVRYRLLPGIW